MSDPVVKMKKLSMKLARLGFDTLFVMDYPDDSVEDNYAMWAMEGVRESAKPNKVATINRLLNQMKYCMALGGYELEFKVRQVKNNEAKE